MFHIHGCRVFREDLLSPQAQAPPSTVHSFLRHRQSSTGGSLSSLRFFVWARQQPNYCHTALMYSRACEFLGIHRRQQLLNDLLKAYRVERSPVSEKAFKIILNLCRQAKLPDQALGVLRKMRDFGCPPVTSSYNVKTTKIPWRTVCWRRWRMVTCVEMI